MVTFINWIEEESYHQKNVDSIGGVRDLTWDCLGLKKDRRAILYLERTNILRITEGDPNDLVDNRDGLKPTADVAPLNAHVPCAHSVSIEKGERSRNHCMNRSGEPWRSLKV